MNLTAIADRTFTSNTDYKDYRLLYQQTKKNVSIFISHVDKELSKILIDHEREKQLLRQENQMLKDQVKMQMHSFMSSKKSQLDQSEERRNTSNTKFYSQEKMRDIMDCGLSQISMVETKSIVSERKRGAFGDILTERCLNFDSKAANDKDKNLIKDRNDSILKQNQWDIESNNLSQLKIRMTENKRGKRIANICKIDDKDSIKDVLKTIREKANTSMNKDRSVCHNESIEIKNIITPNLFSYKRT